MSDRTMYDAVCSECGAQTQVPFQPRGDKPVACRDCFRAARNGGSPRAQQQGQQGAAPVATTTALATQSSALAVRVVGQSEQLALGRRNVEIVWKELTIQDAMTYKLPGGQVGMLSNVWDFVAQERGISFGTPTILENTDDRVVVEVPATYMNRMGRQVEDSETYEIDCQWVYQMKRLSWAPPEWEDVRDENGNLIWLEGPDGKRRPKRRHLDVAAQIEALQANGYLLDEPEYNEQGIPVAFKRKLPPAVEKELWDNLLSLKRFKLAKAITNAHRRLTQRAIGTKTLTAGTLKLMFPAMIEHFTDAQIQEAVDDVYGEDDFEPTRSRPDVEDAEFTASPGPAPAPAAQPPAEPPPAQPEASATAPEPADEKALRNELYRAIFGIARKCGDKNEAAVRQRLAEWGCCTKDADGRPSLRASSLAQVRDAAARYERLLEEIEQSAEVAF